MGFRPRVSETRVYSLHHSPLIGADRGNWTLMGLRPSAPRADVSPVPPHPQRLRASTRSCASLSALPRQSVASYGLDAKFGRRPRCRTERCLRVEQVTSLAVSPTKMAAGVGIAPTSRRLTDGRSTFELPGNGQVGGNCTRFPGFTGRCSAD